MDNIKRKIRQIILVIILFILVINLINMIHSKVSINSNSGESMDVSTSINLFTYNIFEYDLNLVLPVLEDSDADIVVLQEVEYSYDNDALVDGVKWLAAKLNMSHFSDDGNTDYGGVSILSRWPIIQSNVLSLGKIDGYIDRFMVGCIVDSPYGELVVMGTHLQQPNYIRDRSNQVDKILSEVESFGKYHPIVHLFVSQKT